MKTKIILIVCFFLSIQSNAQQWQWSLEGKSNLDENSLITNDASNNIYLFGYFDGDSLQIGNYSLKHNNGDMFFMKILSSGNIAWEKQLVPVNPIGNSCKDGAGAICFDKSSNNIYIAGSYCIFLYFDTFMLYNNNGSQNIFLAKYDLNGTLLWAKSSEGSAGGCQFLLTDDLGNLFMAGSTADTMWFDSIIIYPGSFIAKFDSNGNCLWAKNICSMTSYIPFIPGFFTKSMILKNGYLFINCSKQNDTIIIDTLSFIHPGKWGSLIGKYDLNGNRVWLKETIGLSNIWSGSLGVDNGSNIYTCGHFSDTLIIEGNSFLPPLNSLGDYYITKYDSIGNLLWFKQGYGKTASANALICDDNGNFYLTGLFSDTTQFGNMQVVAETKRDMFLGRFDSSGNCMGLKHFGKAAEGYALTVDNNNEPIVITHTEWPDTCVIDNNTFINQGRWDIIVTKSDAITSIDETVQRKSNSLLIYQNPSNGKFNIDIPDELLHGNRKLSLTIYDEQGKIIQQSAFIVDQEKITMDINAESKGIYLITLSDNKQVYSGKIVFQ